MKNPSKKVEDSLFKIASEQQGYFTTSQAIDAGFQDATHPYHVRCGDWIREWRGIYRLARYPIAEEGQYVLWSLWSRNRKGFCQGIYSHQTALMLFDLSDIMPAKLHITVPPGFRRHSKIPGILVLHRANVMNEEIEERAGYSVTRPARTIMDLIIEESVSVDIIQQAFSESKKRGLVRNTDFQRYRSNPEVFLKISDCIGEIDSI